MAEITGAAVWEVKLPGGVERRVGGGERSREGAAPSKAGRQRAPQTALCPANGT